VSARVLLLLVLALSGCKRETPPPPPPPVAARAPVEPEPVAEAPAQPEAAAAEVAAALDAGQELSLAVTVPRPAEGEFFGLYMLGRKVGYQFTQIKLVPGASPPQLQMVNEVVFKANVGSKVSERYLKETKRYLARPGGRLLSIVVEQRGDGGNQTLEGTATPTGLRVIRRRPGHPNEVLNRPPAKEVVEDADQARVALALNRKVEGFMADGQDLETYRLTTTLGEETVRAIGGVNVKLRQATTLSEKEKVPADAYLDEKGRMVEIAFGATVRAVAESEHVAKRLDQVEVFGLTRVQLPRLLPDSAKKVPGSVTLVMTGLPEKFHKNTERQKYKVAGDRVEVTLSARPPTSKAKSLPLMDPAGGANMKATIIVESDNPQIRALGKSIVGAEKDAFVAAKKIVAWVNQNLEKDYGASADRATDVLAQKKGDCTEHSLLAVALMRAVGIPSKRVDGVVYMVNDDRVPALYWHEWVEAYVGEWVAMDPTFGQEIADATHFAVGEEGNAEITPLIGALKVVEVR
jgi:hypothetical protein